MEWIILWVVLLLSVGLLVRSYKKTPIKEWVIVFLIQAYLATFIGVIVAEEKMLEYPVRMFPKYFESNILYEYLILPVISIYFYQATHHLNISRIILQAINYSFILTIVEVLIEKYTDLIQYHTWNWMYTFVSTFLILLAVRLFIGFIQKVSIEKK